MLATYYKKCRDNDRRRPSILQESLLLQRFFEFAIMMIDEHQCRSDSMTP